MRRSRDGRERQRCLLKQIFGAWKVFHQNSNGVGGAAETAGTGGKVVITYTPKSALVKPPNNLGLVGYWKFDEGTTKI